MSEPREPIPQPRTGRRIGARHVVGLILVATLIVFLAENTRKVKIRFIGPEVEAPLLFALLISALLGALMALALAIQFRRRR
ncbi:MAG: DUF1049 domain-containing protein [Actinomycetota bacterium]